jgi:hypothetical protein
MAITGHRTSKEINRYTRGASQRILAANAIAQHGPLNVTNSEAINPSGAQDEGLNADLIDKNLEWCPGAASNSNITAHHLASATIAPLCSH